MGRTYGQNCPIALTLEIVGDRWTMLIVRELLAHGSRRFADFEATLTGIAPNVLSDRLKSLEDSAMVTREVYSQRPLRASYRLTEAGNDLGFISGALAYFGSRHLMHDAKLTHGSSGHSVAPRYYCPDCDSRIPAGEVWPDFEGSPYRPGGVTAG